MIYRVQVKLPNRYRYPAYKTETPLEAIQSAIKQFPQGISFKVVVELERVTDDWGIDYSEEEN